MGCVTSNQADRTVTLRPAEAELESVEYSKSLASPGNGLTSPKQRFARRTSAHKGVMSSIAMKFPHIKRSFVACKRVFELHADRETNTIPKSKVTEVLVELGANPDSLSQESVDHIIQKANLDQNEVIDFKEFLIAAAVGCFLRADPNTEQLTPCFLSIRKGFEAAKEAFGKIDKDGSGEIEFQELKEAFLAMKEDDLILERLRELDFNGDKSIEFPEFVWGLSAWVGMDEDLDDEEEEEMESFILDQPPTELVKEEQKVNVEEEQKKKGEEVEGNVVENKEQNEDEQQIALNAEPEEQQAVVEAVGEDEE